MVIVLLLRFMKRDCFESIFFRKDTIFEVPYTEKELEPFPVFFYQSFSFSAFWAEVFDSS